MPLFGVSASTAKNMLLALAGCVAVLVVAALVLKHRVPRLNLAGRTALITGGSTGIGLELAKQFAKKGAHVVIAARRKAVLETAVAEITRVAPTAKVSFVTMDVGDAAAIAAGVTEARQWSAKVGGTGEIDVLVCSAGFSIPSRFLDISDENARRMMDINFFGCTSVTKAVIGRMYERKAGRVVLVGSMGGAAPVCGFTYYGATKAALKAFAASLDMESASRGVRIQVINPPDVNTPGFEEENKMKSPECKEVCAMSNSVMDPSEFAAGCVEKIERYTFQINVGFDAWALGTAVAGMDPPSDEVQLLAEVCLGGILRLVSSVYTFLHYRIVRKVHKKEGIAA